MTEHDSQRLIDLNRTIFRLGHTRVFQEKRYFTGEFDLEAMASLADRIEAMTDMRVFKFLVDGASDAEAMFIFEASRCAGWSVCRSTETGEHEVGGLVKAPAYNCECGFVTAALVREYLEYKNACRQEWEDFKNGGSMPHDAIVLASISVDGDIPILVDELG